MWNTWVKKRIYFVLYLFKKYILEIFMVEFGLQSEEEETKLITEVDKLKKTLGEKSYVFFDESYEMANNPLTCLVQKLEDTRKEENYRNACDGYLLGNLDAFGQSNFGVLTPEESDDDRLRKYEELIQTVTQCEAE